VTLAVFRHLDAAVAIKHTKESYAFAIEVLVANVGVLHGEPPALHGAERVPVPGWGRARLLMFESSHSKDGGLCVGGTLLSPFG